MRVIAFGDSITLGQIGAPYVNYIDADVENLGVNGLTTATELETVDSWLSENSLDDVDAFILAIGSNDLIGPFLMENGDSGWKKYYESGDGSKQTYLEDAEDFKVVFRQIVEELAATGKKTVIACPPHLQLEGFDVDKETAQDETIMEVGKEFGVEVIDTKSIEMDYFGASKYYRTNSARNAYLSGIALTLLGMIPLSDILFPVFGGTFLTIDGIHSSRTTAKLEGCAINNALNG